MAMKNMKLDPNQAREMCQPAMADAPLYPYGLQLNLDEQTLKKLGVKELPEVGSYLMIKAKVEVCSTSEYETQKSESRCLGLQITDMELSGAKREVSAEKLYDKKD